MFYKTDRFRQQVAKQEDVISFVAKTQSYGIQIVDEIFQPFHEY